MLVSVLGAVVRHGIGAAGGAAAVDGAATGNDWQALLGAVMTAASIAWSIWEKRSAAK